jgi:alcohol dehydrogenase class IV
MTPFRFQTTRSILSEAGATYKIGEILAASGCLRIALITDQTILDLGIAEAAIKGCRDAGLEVVVISDVQPDPPEAMILSAVEKLRDERIDGVASVGGGSSMDTAKLIAVLLNSNQELEDIYGVNQVIGDRLPLVLAPTTAGTGSEVTPISIVTTGANEKKGVVSPQLLPDWAILDAELTVGLPAQVTAATGIDAMVHAIEAYTSKRLKNLVSDCLAKQALELLGANIRKACFTMEDREARGQMLLGSTLAGMAFANAPVAAVHALAYPLGGHFHVPHGLSNALVLPYVLEFNMPEAQAMYAELAPIIFPELAGKSEVARAEGIIDSFIKLSSDLGLETQLSQVGVNRRHLPMLAEDAMKQHRLLINNPRKMTLEAAQHIYERALGGVFLSDPKALRRGK